MVEIRWTSQAINGLDSIAEYIAFDSPQHATLFVIDIMESVERLHQFPQAGRVVPEFNSPELREIIFGSYRIVYRLKSPLVEILTVHHGSRLLDEKEMDA